MNSLDKILNRSEDEAKAYEVAEEECMRLMGCKAREGDLFETYRRLIVRIFLKGVEYAKRQQ